MKRYLVAVLLAVANPNFAEAKASLPMIGWSVSPGQSMTGSKICTLSGGLGEHSDLAWVADAASPPQRFTLVFDDGVAVPQLRILASTLTVAAPGAPPMSFPGTIRFGQFKTVLDRQALKSFLHLFTAQSSMTVALAGQSQVPVNLKGSADAALDMRHCEAVQNIPQLPVAPVRLAAASTHHEAPPAAPNLAAPRLLGAIATPLPASTPAAPALPAPLPPIAPAVPTPPLAAAVPSPAPTPAEPPAPAPPAAAATASPAAQLALNDTLLIAKAVEDQFSAILQVGKISYENTSDQTLSLGARANRATDLCALLGNDREAIDWTGTVSDVSSSSQDGGVLTVELADGIEVGTMKDSSSDGRYMSMIEPASGLFGAISQLHVGEPVTFSGKFFASDEDCLEETSPTQTKSMTSPYFLIRFTSVEPRQ